MNLGHWSPRQGVIDHWSTPFFQPLKTNPDHRYDPLKKPSKMNPGCQSTRPYQTWKNLISF
jgi:hypothetical protein